jgi:hypothetical protein
MTHQEKSMRSYAFPLTGPINLQARLGRGTVTVEAVTGLTDATVELTPRRPESDIAERVEVDLRGDTLTITAPREGGVFDMIFAGNNGRTALDTVIRVPTGTAAKISTVSADITVRGTVGGLDIASGSADITVAQVSGDLRLRYGSGHCAVERVDGTVTSRSGSGTARYGRIGGGLNAGCGSGEIVVAHVGGPVRSRAGSGRFTLERVDADVDLASGSGPMAIGLPAGRPARLDVTTGSGRVDSELPIRDRPGVSVSKGRPIRVRARTGSGDIRLFRAPS